MTFGIKKIFVENKISENKFVEAKVCTYIKLTISVFFIFTNLHGQETETDRLIAGELQMTFPSIYFKHNSTEYAAMPYTTDSCFKYIVFNFNSDVNSLVVWRDSAETELLANKRIQKLKLTLKKYSKKIQPGIYSMGDLQKVARHTIKQTNNNTKTDYLLTLNSVFEISKTRVNNKTKYTNHIMSPRITCWGCWKSGFHWRSRMKIHKMQKRNKSTATN